MTPPNSGYFSNSIFWVEVERIKPNPYQPRKVFDETALASLSESIRQYGVLQPLTVTRREIERPGEGIFVEYELVAGERRLRASKLAGLLQVPVVIRSAEDTDRMKLELAIIENLQREDLNAVDRALAFRRLADEFNLKHTEIAARVGKSREYVSNTMRILLLPEEILNALRAGEITDGHTRPLLMLNDKPEEQMTLFKDITNRRLTVRDAEQLARRGAIEKVRNHNTLSADVISLEKQLTERLGTRVRIEKKEQGGKVTIDFFSPEDLTQLCMVLSLRDELTAEAEILARLQNVAPPAISPQQNAIAPESAPVAAAVPVEVTPVPVQAPAPAPVPPVKDDAEDLYSVTGFTV